MGKNNKKLELDKNLLYDMYVVREMTVNQIKGELHKMGIDCGVGAIRNCMRRNGIPFRSRSENTTIQIKNQKKDNLFESIRHKAGKSNSQHYKDMTEEERVEYSKICSNSRQKYYNNRTEEQITRDIELARVRGEKGREVRRNNPNGYGWSTTPEKNAKRVERGKETKKRNGSFRGNTSNAEDNYYIFLKEIFGEVVRRYTDDRYIRESDGYHFECDFYVPSKDLFIEYQGYYTHQTHPYGTNKDDNTIVETLKSKNYNNVIETWTDRDVTKITSAKNNKINLLLVYPDKNDFDYYLVSNGELNALTDLTTL